MTPSLLLATLLSAAPPSLSPSICAQVALVPVDPDAYRELWEAGQTWDAFLADAESRRELWLENWTVSEGIDVAAVERARAAGGSWHVLAVAIDGCSDSVSTIPFLARLASQVDGLELRIVDSAEGAWIMEAHPTPDGRPATPTVMLLGPDFEEHGCFIERPTPLQTRIIENPDGLGQREIFDFKMGWYAEDRGATTVAEFVEILEAAASGSTRCG
jgi:hypothetical protein